MSEERGTFQAYITKPSRNLKIVLIVYLFKVIIQFYINNYINKYYICQYLPITNLSYIQNMKEPAVIYIRKSTDNKNKQVLSLEAQRCEMIKLAKTHNLDIVEIFEESASAYKTGRPVLKQMLKAITLGKAKTILTWKFNRLARNLKEGGEIVHMLQQGDIEKIITYEKTYTDKDHAVILAVELGSANQDSRNISVDVKRGYRKKLEKGGWPYKAPLGYKTDHNLRKPVIDRKIAKHIKKMFELYSTGDYSTKALAEILYDDGFRSKAGNKVSHSNIHLMLQRKFYFGLMESNGKLYQGTHTPLITKKMYDLCQEVRTSYKKIKPQQEKKLDFSLRGLFSCGKCGCAITAQKQKGINYYNCTNGKKICDAKKKYYREDELESSLLSQLETLGMDSELIDIVHDASLERFHNEVVDTKADKKRLEAELQALKAKESMLTDKLLERVISNDVYASKSNELQLEIFDCERRIEESELDIEKELATFELTKKAFKAFDIKSSEFSDMDSDKKSQTLKKLLSNSTLKYENGDKSLYLQYKKPYDVIARADYTELCPELLPD